MNNKNLSPVLKIILWFLILPLTTACVPSSYICPLKDQPGACTSQLNTYRATLNNRVNIENDSIFDKSQA